MVDSMALSDGLSCPVFRFCLLAPTLFKQNLYDPAGAIRRTGDVDDNGKRYGTCASDYDRTDI